jgi:hypothetical protein
MATSTSEKVESTLSGEQLKVAPDRLSVMLTVTPEFAAKPDAMDAIRAEFERKKITAPLDVNLLTSSLEQVAATGLAVHDLVIASGTALVPPIDARLEWTKEFFASGYYVDPETKYIDYHRKAATPSIDKDEIIAKALPPVAGKEGCDVFGAALAPAKPKPRDTRAGAKVSFDEATGFFKAQCSGRVKLDGKSITVVDVYQVPSSVGPASGNIDHSGSVVINGGIDSEFKVRAVGDIEVRDVIGAADIECGGNLTAHKGISSTTGKKIIVKGNLHAKYLEHATVVSEGDVVVESEILDSSIRTTGKVICPGRVRGGDIMAASGIQIGEAGSHTESRTALIVGIDYHVVNGLREAAEESKVLKEAITKLETEVKKLELLGSRMNHQQREAMTELGFKLFESRSRYDELTEIRKKLAPLMQAHRDAVILIEKQINSGTVLRVVDANLEIRDALLGPIIASLDPVTKLLTLTSKDTPAKE